MAPTNDDDHVILFLSRRLKKGRRKDAHYLKFVSFSLRTKRNLKPPNPANRQLLFFCGRTFVKLLLFVLRFYFFHIYW